MTRYGAIVLFACLLAGCTTSQPDGAPKTAAAKRVHCEAPAGSHIVDSSNCSGSDPFVRHAVIANPNGTPLQTQGQ